MPKNWPSDTITKHKGRKKHQPIPELPGWKYFEATTNLFLHCEECRGLGMEMFYRYEKKPVDTVGITRAKCVPCGLKMLANQPAGPGGVSAN